MTSRMRFTSLLLILVAATTVLHAGSVSILPMKPAAESTITIEYTPDQTRSQWLKDAKGIHAVVYAFSADNEVPQATDVDVQPEGGRLAGTYTLPAGTVYLMVKVGRVNEYDNNKGEYWDARVYDASGKQLPYAALREGTTYMGSLPETLRREQDVEHAIELLEEEGRLFPKSLMARINVVILRKSTGMFTEQEAKAKLADLIPSNVQPATLTDAVALVQGYGLLGRELDVNRIRDYARARWPKNRLEEQALLQQLSEAKTAEGFITTSMEYMNTFPDGMARQSIIDAAINNTSRAGDYTALAMFIRGSKNLPATAYQTSVNFLGAVDSLRPEAYQFIEMGFKAAEDPKLRPSYIGATEWKEYQRRAISNLWFIKGAIQNADQRSDDAVASLKKAITIGGVETERNAYEIYAGILKQRAAWSEVGEVSRTAIANGASSDSLVAAFKEARSRDGKSADAIESELTDLRKKGRSLASRKLATSLLNMPMIDGTFTTLDGTPTNISDWKGKVVILDYWATWCGPCKMSFPSLQKLYERYKNNPNVVFAIVNVWERSQDRTQTVKDFLASNKNLTFPMYMDKTDAVVSKYGVTGIPTKFFLGKDGRIQFKEVGLLPEAQFLDEAENKIELLLAQ